MRFKKKKKKDWYRSRIAQSAKDRSESQAVARQVDPCTPSEEERLYKLS
jgi:hypothetical protein